MSDLKSLLTTENIILNAKAGCRREALTVLSRHCADVTGVSSDVIHQTLLDREALGSTGIGNGIAIPHGKFSHVNEMTGVLVRLDKPVEYDAVDDRPVDLFFALLAPEDANAAHLKALSRVARLLRDENTRRALRGAHSAEALHAIIIEHKLQAA